MTTDDAIAFLEVHADKNDSARSRILQDFVRTASQESGAAEVVATAIETFASDSDAYLWLSRPNLLLQNKSPLEVMAAGNTASVQRLLAAINYGSCT